MQRFLRRFLPILWLTFVVTGGIFLVRHQTTAGAVGASPEQWPRAAKMPEPSGRPALIMFAHPWCPCTRASLEALNRLLVQCFGRIHTHVVFVDSGTKMEVSEAQLWSTATRIPGVKIHRDTGGEQARLFGAFTSGHVVLYSAQGKLLFSGGVTAGRGHAGDNAGLEAVATLVKSGIGMKSTPVYGCPLFSPCEREIACVK